MPLTDTTKSQLKAEPEVISPYKDFTTQRAQNSGPLRALPVLQTFNHCSDKWIPARQTVTEYGFIFYGWLHALAFEFEDILD